MARIERIVTIGGHGFDAESFFAALVAAGVDTFCDVRLRRGMRGRKHAFANSKRLQQRLDELGIRYVHVLDLAPSHETRAIQQDVDAADHVAVSERAALSPAFVRAYEKERLRGFDLDRFLEDVGPDARVVALFCVEEKASACHRALAAAHLGKALKVPVEHLEPS